MKTADFVSLQRKQRLSTPTATRNGNKGSSRLRFFTWDLAALQKQDVFEKGKYLLMKKKY